MAAPFRPWLTTNLRYRCFPWFIELHSNHGQFNQFVKNTRNLSSDILGRRPVNSISIVSANHTFTLPKNNYNTRYFSSNSDRTCWKCGDKVDTKEELFFCKCGVVQDVKGLDFFELMGFPESFDIDTKLLTRRYRDLQRQLHPDKYSLKSEKEKQIAEEQSSYVNKAYFTLLKPLPRAQYLLERRGVPIEEDNTSVDQGFLMQVMEINEEIMDADTPDSLQPIQMSNDANMKNCVIEISKAFSDNDVDKAKDWTVKLKYFTNINDKIINIHQKHFGAH
ncbi:iron-sulfur cluster co-chaperone protein HscB-like [Saccostrea echinata]|uniref:iron-sulfur cluster co-chaperone protein HscB-like n=1 Tax=Saccostrea echinata TaxID=191078 RepID=UPI002A7F6E5A|nr:iron-sulfur cluster co-chaperone protein HscB-like [Saccostrea echinata]